MGRKAGNLYINPKKLGNMAKPCMKEMSPGKVHLVLEYCKGGDLSVYVQRHGIFPEATAKHFMQQLAAGLQVLRDNTQMKTMQIWRLLILDLQGLGNLLR
ncbi:unnamed protein product [Arabidopsis halleri]